VSAGYEGAKATEARAMTAVRDKDAALSRQALAAQRVEAEAAVLASARAALETQLAEVTAARDASAAAKAAQERCSSR
jgi:hypothetical protein